VRALLDAKPEGVIVHMNVWLVDRVPSDTVTVTGYVPPLAADRVPEISPVAASIASPAGTPLAL